MIRGAGGKKEDAKNRDPEKRRAVKQGYACVHHVSDSPAQNIFTPFSEDIPA
jgi:hypothetical protein